MRNTPFHEIANPACLQADRAPFHERSAATHSIRARSFTAKKSYRTRAAATRVFRVDLLDNRSRAVTRYTNGS